MFLSLRKSYVECRLLERQYWMKADLWEAIRSMGIWVPRRSCRQQSSHLHPSKNIFGTYAERLSFCRSRNCRLLLLSIAFQGWESNLCCWYTTQFMANVGGRLFLRPGLIHTTIASYSLCGKGWPWTPDLPVSTSWSGSTQWVTLPTWCGAGDQTQGFMHAEQAFHQPSYSLIPVYDTFLFQ